MSPWARAAAADAQKFSSTSPSSAYKVLAMLQIRTAYRITLSDLGHLDAATHFQLLSNMMSSHRVSCEPSLTVNLGFINSRSNCLELKCMSSGRRCSSRVSAFSLSAFGFRPFLPLGGVTARALLAPVAGRVIAAFDGANSSLADGDSEFSKSMRNGVFSFRVCLATAAFSAGSTAGTIRSFPSDSK